MFDRIFARPIGTSYATLWPCTTTTHALRRHLVLLGTISLTPCLGHRCFQDFILNEYGAQDPAALRCFNLTTAVKALSSAKPDEAVDLALKFRAEHIDCEVRNRPH